MSRKARLFRRFRYEGVFQAILAIASLAAEKSMAAYKTPDFTERNAAAREARQRALEQLRAKPAPDPEIVAARQAAREAREAAAAERRAAKLAAEAEAKEAARAAKEAAEQAELEAAAAKKASRPKPPTEAEMKAARDARYAARKARKR